jgi:CBS domain-containing protein
MIDDGPADWFPTGLADRTVAEAMPDKRGELPVVGPDARVLEVAALRGPNRIPLVTVVDGREMLGAISLSALLDRTLAT